MTFQQIAESIIPFEEGEDVRVTMWKREKHAEIIEALTDAWTSGHQDGMRDAND
jgi:hypothetical protein